MASYMSGEELDGFKFLPGAVRFVKRTVSAPASIVKSLAHSAGVVATDLSKGRIASAVGAGFTAIPGSLLTTGKSVAGGVGYALAGSKPSPSSSVSAKHTHKIGPHKASPTASATTDTSTTSTSPTSTSSQALPGTPGYTTEGSGLPGMDPGVPTVYTSSAPPSDKKSNLLPIIAIGGGAVILGIVLLSRKKKAV